MPSSIIEGIKGRKIQNEDEIGMISCKFDVFLRHIERPLYCHLPFPADGYQPQSGALPVAPAFYTIPQFVLDPVYPVVKKRDASSEI